MHKHLIKNSGLTLISIFVVGITQLIFNVVIARFFNSEILGAVNLALSTALLFSVIVSSGLNPANNKFTAEYLGRKEEEQVKKIYSFTLILSIILSLMISLIMVLFQKNISEWFNISSNYLISIPLVLFYALYLLLKGMFYGINKVRDYMIIELISGGVFFISLVFVVISKIYLLLPFVAGYLTFSTLSLFSLKKYFILNFWDKIIKKVVNYSLIAFMGTFSSLARTRLSIIIPAIFLAKGEIGLFSAAFSLLNLFYFLPRTISLVITPLISYKYGENNEEDILKTLNLTNKYITIYTIIFSGLMIILSSLVLTILFGQEYIISTSTLQILSISALFTILTIPSVNTLSATKYNHIPNIAGVLGLVFSLISWLILIPRYHLVGIALGFLIGTIVNSIIPVYYTNKYFKPKSTMRIIIKGIISFGIAYIFIKFPILSAALFLIINLFLNKDDLINFVRRIRDETRT